MTKRINYFTKKTKDSVLDYLKEIIEIIKKPEMGILPGQLAFFILLSLVPIITLIGYAAGLFNINMDTIVELLNDVFPAGAKELVPYITGNTIDLTLALVLIWIFYLASNGFNTVIVISNQIYGINKSNWFKRRIKAIFMTLVTVVLFLVLLIMPAYGSKLLELVPGIHIHAAIITAYQTFKLPLTWLMMFIYIRTVYEIAPDRVRKNSHLNTGALFTSVCWVVITIIYTNYTSNLDTYNLFYGALSSIATLMIWLYFMSFVFVIGLCLNYGREKDIEVFEKTGAVKILKNR